MNHAFKRNILVAASMLAFGAGASAQAAQAAQGSGSVDYISGGVSLDARHAMMGQVGPYNLHLEFAAAPEGEYLSDVDVNVANARGESVLQTRTTGPWLFARLPAGTYSVTAKAAGATRTQQITVGGGRRHLVIRFPALDDRVAGTDLR